MQRPPAATAADTRPQRIDAALKLLRYIGLFGFLGGLAALAAMWYFGPMPANLGEWRLLIGLVRPTFYACVFGGIVVLVLAGGASWWRQRRDLHGARWFRLMIGLLVVAVPTMHLLARSTALRLYDAVDDGLLQDAEALWNQLGLLFAIGFIVMLAIASLGIARPRLGQGMEPRMNADEHR